MYLKKRVLAIIPARKGSKRLKNKNLRDFCGEPLILKTIKAAIESKYIDQVLVSTDSEKIRNLALQNNVEAPFLRPKYLANDTAKTIDVIFHALDYYKSNKNNFDYCILLQPTSPLRTSLDIDNAVKNLTKNVKAIVSVCKTSHSPIWSNTLPENLSMSNFIDGKFRNIRSQDLPVYYQINGSIYISEIEYLKSNNGFFGNQTKAFIMPKNRSVDIDDEGDFFYAEYEFKKKQNEK